MLSNLKIPVTLQKTQFSERRERPSSNYTKVHLKEGKKMAVVCYYCAVVAASYQNLEFKHSFQTCSDSFSNSKNYWIPAEAKVIIEKDHQNSVALLALTKNSKDLGPIFTFSNTGCYCWKTLYYLKSHNIFLQEIH